MSNLLAFPFVKIINYKAVTPLTTVKDDGLYRVKIKNPE